MKRERWEGSTTYINNVVPPWEPWPPWFTKYTSWNQNHTISTFISLRTSVNLGHTLEDRMQLSTTSMDAFCFLVMPPKSRISFRGQNASKILNVRPTCCHENHLPRYAISFSAWWYHVQRALSSCFPCKFMYWLKIKDWIHDSWSIQYLRTWTI